MDPQDQAVLQQMFVQQAQDERRRREADEIQKRLVDTQRLDLVGTRG